MTGDKAMRDAVNMLGIVAMFSFLVVSVAEEVEELFGDEGDVAKDELVAPEISCREAR